MAIEEGDVAGQKDGWSLWRRGVVASTALDGD